MCDKILKDALEIDESADEPADQLLGYQDDWELTEIENQTYQRRAIRFLTTKLHEINAMQSTAEGYALDLLTEMEMELAHKGDVDGRI